MQVARPDMVTFRIEEALSILHESPGDFSPQFFFEQAFGDHANFYPGHPTRACHPVCVVWSVRPEGAQPKRNSYIKFPDALRQLRVHADLCPETRRLILVTNNWGSSEFSDWADTLVRLRAEGRDVQFVLVTGRSHTWLQV